MSGFDAVGTRLGQRQPLFSAFPSDSGGAESSWSTPQCGQQGQVAGKAIHVGEPAGAAGKRSSQQQACGCATIDQRHRGFPKVHSKLFLCDHILPAQTSAQSSQRGPQGSGSFRRKGLFPSRNTKFFLADTRSLTGALQGSPTPHEHAASTRVPPSSTLSDSVMSPSLLGNQPTMQETGPWRRLSLVQTEAADIGNVSSWS